MRLQCPHQTVWADCGNDLFRGRFKRVADSLCKAIDGNYGFYPSQAGPCSKTRIAAHLLPAIGIDVPKKSARQMVTTL